MRYIVIFETANGRQFEAECDHAPCLDTVIRVPGTDIYATVIGIRELVGAGETCSDPHCAACDAGVPHETTPGGKRGSN